MKGGGGEGAFFLTPPHSFTCAIFRAVFDCLFDSCSSFSLLLNCIETLATQAISVTNVDICEKKQFSLHFFFSLLQVNIVHRVSFIFRVNAFLVSVCTKGPSYFRGTQRKFRKISVRKTI